MEDYEYFAILEQLAGKEIVKKIVNTVAPNWWNFSKEPEKFLAAREELAEEIMKRQKERKK